MTKEALIVIPGFDAKEFGFALNRTIESINNQQSIADISKVPTPENPNMQRLEVTFFNSEEKKQLDIYEVFWGDIIEKNSTQEITVWRKVIFGLELMFFWFFSPIWKAAYKNKWMFTGIAFSGIIITFWYISILGVFISALDSTEALNQLKSIFIEEMPDDEAMRMGLSVQELPRLVSIFFTEIFLIAGLVIGLFPTLMSLILRVSGFSMKFIKSQMVRDDVKNRVQFQMNAIHKNEYDRVTFFAHSLGVIPTLDFLSGYDSIHDNKIRLITVGSPVSFLANKAKVFLQHAEAVKENQKVVEWADYFSKADWLCSYESLGEQGERIFSQKIAMDSGWLNRMSTAPHLAYFNHSVVVEKLIND
jgi:predicted alpha/beta hydrolase family esterase